MYLLIDHKEPDVVHFKRLKSVIAYLNICRIDGDLKPISEVKYEL